MRKEEKIRQLLQRRVEQMSSHKEIIEEHPEDDLRVAVSEEELMLLRKLENSKETFMRNCRFATGQRVWCTFEKLVCSG